MKGTTFFGGSGMVGFYVEDMVAALREAGIKNVRAAERGRWSKGGVVWDVLSVLFANSRDDRPSDLSGFGRQGAQFNLVGYSYGGVQAAQVAADYADQGGVVDHLVLIGTPVGKGFLKELKSHLNIRSVMVIDLARHGDPIHAGMGILPLLSVAPEVGWQFLRGYDGRKPKEGHFYFTGLDPLSAERRRALAVRLIGAGLK